LLLLYQRDDRWYLPLTVRGVTLRQHGGQVSLPGGRMDPGETPEQTALRESFEEIGLMPDEVMLLGRLTPLPIPISRHLLQPVIGYTRTTPAFLVGEGEVDRIIEMPLARLRAPDAVGWQTLPRSLPPVGSMDVPFFDVDGAQIWGATAMILAEFLAIVDETERTPASHR
jgi:8-oxo-dGTP pyrophosphatase MutT (NUDIX family)